MFKFLKKKREKRDKEYLEKMFLKVKNAANDELVNMNYSYHYGLDMSLKMGDTIDEVSLRIDKFIEDEMHSRGMKTLDDLEEDIWFATR